MFTSSEPSRLSPGVNFFRLAIGGEAGLLLLAWGLGRWFDVSPLEYLRDVGPGLLWGTAAALPMGLALLWMLRTSRAPFRRLVELVEDQLGSFLRSLSLLELGILAAIAGVSEEILFRGVLLPALSRNFAPLGGLILSSVLFGLVHFASKTYAVIAGMMGCYLGMLFLVTDSLIAPIVSHGLYDFAALVVVARRTQPRQR